MTIHAHIVSKDPRNGSWVIVADYPGRTAAMPLRVLAGRPAMVFDPVTDELIVTGTSLADVLQNLADLTRMTVELHDPANGRNTHTYHPAPAPAAVATEACHGR